MKKKIGSCPLDVTEDDGPFDLCGCVQKPLVPPFDRLESGIEKASQVRPLEYFQIGPLDLSSQIRHTVSAEVKELFVMDVIQMRARWHFDHCCTVGFKNSMHVVQRGLIVFDVFKYVQQHDAIYALVGKRALG